MAEPAIDRGLLDTSVVIDLERVAHEALPTELAVSAITMAELAAGPHATNDPAERARRQDRLQRAEATFDPLPVDATVARAYARIYAAVAGTSRKARGARSLDLLIAATALAFDLPLYTRNPDDFRGIGSLVDVIDIPPVNREALEAYLVGSAGRRRLGAAKADRSGRSDVSERIEEILAAEVQR